MIKSNKGASLIELITVIMIMSIISVVVVSRIISLQSVDMVARENTVKSQIRYAQATAMKSNGIRGIKCDGTDYWMFKNTDPDNSGNQVQLPGEDSIKIALPEMDAFTLFFDRFGIPYSSYTDENTNTPVPSPLTINIDTRSFKITPETGFIDES
jgi:type II secretory pathway pseudopilin PulG